MTRATTIVSTLAALAVLATGTETVSAQQPQQPQPQPLRIGGVLSGELVAIATRSNGKRVMAYQITSEPRKLPGADGLCNLETGPETFQIVTNSDAQASLLKSNLGKQVALKVDEVACAQEAGQMSEAVVTKWSVVTKH